MVDILLGRYHMCQTQLSHILRFFFAAFPRPPFQPRRILSRRACAGNLTSPLLVFANRPQDPASLRSRASIAARTATVRRPARRVLICEFFGRSDHLVTVDASARCVPTIIAIHPNNLQRRSPGKLVQANFVKIVERAWSIAGYQRSEPADPSSTPCYMSCLSSSS